LLTLRHIVTKAPSSTTTTTTTTALIKTVITKRDFYNSVKVRNHKLRLNLYVLPSTTTLFARPALSKLNS